MRCKAAQEFKHWQLPLLQKGVKDRQYFKGIDEHRPVSYKEAEYDFMVDHATYGISPKLRARFCEDICPYGHDCELGQHFIKQVKAA